MRANQWVAHAGLDPRPHESGTSISKPRRISKAGNKYIRAALFMPALVALKLDPHIKAFYEKLVGAGKKPIQAVVAVMRKLLHAIWGMFNHDQEFIGEKFYAIPLK
jgi:transposase